MGEEKLHDTIRQKSINLARKEGHELAVSIIEPGVGVMGLSASIGTAQPSFFNRVRNIFRTHGLDLLKVLAGMGNLPPLYLVCRRQERVRLRTWIELAKAEAEGTGRLLLFVGEYSEPWKKPTRGKKAFVVMDLHDFCELYRCAAGLKDCGKRKDEQLA